MNGRVYRWGLILRCLASADKTPEEVAHESGASPVATRDTIGRMAVLKIVHQVSASSKLTAARYRLGRPTGANLMPKIRLRPSDPGGGGAALIAFAALVRALAAAPISANDLVETTGCTINTIRMQLAALRKANVAYRAEWHRDREAGEWCAHWRFGIDKRDAVKPRAKTRQELRKRYKSNRRERDATTAIIRMIAANASIFTQAQAA